MKKTLKLLCLSTALIIGTGGAAKAEGFKIGADLVSSFVWRGGDIGDSPAIQPNISYTFSGSGIVLGAWGTYAVKDYLPYGATEKNNYKEVDLYLTVPVGPLSVTLTDYLNATADDTRAFDFSNDGPNVIELSASVSLGDLSLLGAVNIAGADTGNAKYFEAGYKFYDKSGYSAKAIIGAGDEDYYGDLEGDNIALVNTGISVSKDRFTVSYVYNPDAERSHLVFAASF
ncbi:MAG: hypothetical protein HGA70_01305 [Chlorobiaceae bacterium]|nr:hypothetical protein [Chlorobiaceae bacterium]NTW10064.1 hypothetical protein [Chlorobiaceae bacterium]